MVRFAKSVVVGMGGSVIAVSLLAITALAILWVRVQRQKATGMGAVAGGILTWPLYVAAGVGFVLAFVWMWRRS